MKWILVVVHVTTYQGSDLNVQINTVKDFTSHGNCTAAKDVILTGFRGSLTTTVKVADCVPQE